MISDRHVSRVELLKGALSVVGLLVACVGVIKAETDSRKIASMFEAKKYSELDEWAATLRKAVPTVHDYTDDLIMFYAAFPEPSRDKNDAEWEAYRLKLEEWVNAESGSVTAKVLLGRYYIDFGWRARGTGWAKDVTGTGWAGLKDGLKQAGDILDPVSTVEPSDAEIYTLLLAVALGGERTRDQMEEAFKKGTAVRHFCYELYRSKAQYLLQRWYGKRGDVEKFAEQEADALEGEDGDAMYAVIGQQIALTEGRNFLSITDFSWERLSRGFIAIIKNANQADFRKRELNVFLYLSCLNQQLDTAAKLLGGFQAESWDTKFWGDEITLDQLRDFVNKARS